MDNQADRRLEVLRQIPPLMPQFLHRRRGGIPEMRALVEEAARRLGIERRVYFVLVHLHELQGGYGWHPLTLAQVRARDPYSTIDQEPAARAILGEKGFLVRDDHDRISLSPEARETVDELHSIAREHVAHLQPLPADQLDTLAYQLDRAVQAILSDSVLAPRPGSHLAGSHSLATFGPDAPVMVRIEQSVFDLWMARDDAHIKAWQDAGLDGPAMEALTVLWLAECDTVDCLREKLKGNQDSATLDATLTYLADSEYAIRGADDKVQLTPAGALVRQDIERETDRIYFDPWPQTYAEAVVTRDALSKLVDNLPR